MRLGQHLGDRSFPGGAQRSRIDSRALIRQLALDGVGLEELAGEPPQVVDRALDPLMRLLCSITEPNHPAGAVPQVIARLLDRLRCDPREPLVRGLREGRPQLELVRIEEELAGDQVTESAVRLLDQQCVGEVALGAEKGKVVLGSPIALELARVGVEVLGHADVVEGDVGDGQVLLQVGCTGDVLAQPLAEDHVVVCEPKEIGHQRLRRCCRGHICPTSSGIS